MNMHEHDLARWHIATFPDTPRDVVPRPPVDPDVLAAIREAIADFRVTIHFPGMLTEDDDGNPAGVGEPQVIHPGEAEPISGRWNLDDGLDLTEGFDPDM